MTELVERLAAAGYGLVGEIVDFIVEGRPVLVAYVRGPDGVVLTLLRGATGMTARYPRTVLGTCCLPWRDGTARPGPFPAQHPQSRPARPAGSVYLRHCRRRALRSPRAEFREVTELFVETMAGRRRAPPMVGVMNLSLPTVLERIRLCGDSSGFGPSSSACRRGGRSATARSGVSSPRSATAFRTTVSCITISDAPAGSSGPRNTPSSRNGTPIFVAIKYGLGRSGDDRRPPSPRAAAPVVLHRARLLRRGTARRVRPTSLNLRQQPGPRLGILPLRRRGRFPPLAPHCIVNSPGS